MFGHFDVKTGVDENECFFFFMKIEKVSQATALYTTVYICLYFLVNVDFRDYYGDSIV